MAERNVWQHPRAIFMSTKHISMTHPHTGGSNLNSSLSEFSSLSQLLPRVDVGVMRPLEGPLQLFQLLGCEGGPTAALLPLQRQAGLRVHVGGLVRVTGWNYEEKKIKRIPNETLR